MAHELEQSRLERAGEYERVQKKAFTNWVNSHLMKAKEKVTNVYEDFKDGSKLILLLELLTGDKLPREKGKMRVHKLQNVQNALDYLQKVKRIKLVNIRNDEIVDGNPKLILGLLWTLILHFQISEGLQDDMMSAATSRPTSPQEISTKAIKDILLQWAQMATEGYEGVEVTNFHSSWSDGRAFCAIIDRYRPDLLDFEDCDPAKPLENLERAFKVAEEELDIIRIVDPEDVCVPRPDDKAIMTYVSFLHQAFPDMPPARKIRGPDVTPEDYSKLYDSLKSWIGDKKEQASKRDFPSSVEQLKKEMSQLEKVLSKEMPAKKQDKTSLEDMHEKLEAHKKKRPDAEGVPAGKDLTELQADWDSMEEAVNDCHRAMREELKRLEELDALARKLKAECDRHSPAVSELESKVKELEEKSTTMTPAEASKTASNLSHEIEQLLAVVSSLEPGVEKLKNGKHSEAEPIQQRVSALKSSLEALLPRVKNASSAATEAQEVTAMESNLEELEAWLVASGKFSSNQHILRQIQEHRTFQVERLSKAQKDFNRMANSPPPPGLEDKVKEVNERFKRAVKQTDDRLSGLEPIVDEVLEFDSLKNRLEAWCVQEQETLDQLPLLEVTEDKLREQQQECHTLLEDITAQTGDLQKLEELAEKFLRDTEPVQSIADRYARKVRTRVQRSSEENQEPSLGEQAGILQNQFEWLKGRVTERDIQISDLLDKLSQFNLQYNRLREFVDNGNELLEKEKPVGDNATRVQEQMDACQDFRHQIAVKQPAVDAMLSLGREILAEPNTSSASDGLMQKLTGFIQDWSDLQLNWQNWFDELHAGVEQSKSLSDQFKKFESDIRGLGPALTKLFPATVAVKTLDKDLQRLQNKFNSEVVKPYETQKEVYQKLKDGLSLLPDSSEVEQVFKKFEELSEIVEKHGEELSGVREEVGTWWGDCEGASHWLTATESELITYKPLASSLDIIQKQKDSVQALVDGVESQRASVDTTLKALTELAEHKQLLVPTPIDAHRNTLDRRWKALGKEIDGRIELSRCAKDYLSTYANHALPFTTWLKGVESRISSMTTLPRTKDLLLLEKDEMKAFYDEVKVHGETLTQIEIKGSSFLGSSKTYQSQLLAYQRRVDPDLVSSLPKDFVDPRTEDLTSQEVNTENFEGDNYQNGIRVVTGNSASLRRRFDALNAKVKRHQHLVEEGVARRAEFDGCLTAFVDPLSELEARCDGLKLSGESQPLRVQEKVETVRTLEVECMALEPKLHDAQAKYNLLADLCQEEEGEEEGVQWEGHDEALQEKEDAERRHRALLDKLRGQREILNDELSNAEAFHGAFENFLSWLRKTERKTQRDEPIQLQEDDLKAGLKHLKETAADIAAHKPMYETMCAKCTELVGRGVQDAEELKEKLENVQQRWDALQFVSDDIEVIEETIPKLEAFQSNYSGISSDLDNLLSRIDGYSVSAISTDALASKSKELQAFSGEVEKERAGFDNLLNSCGLLETPFDQSQFENNVSALKDKMNQCDKRVSDKKSELKALDRKLRPMEDMFGKFREWLESSRESLSSLSPPPSLAQAAEREKTIRQAQTIVEDVDLHKASLERLEASMGAVLPLLDEPDQDQLRDQFEDLTNQYNCHAFNAEGYLVERWIEGKEAELVAMAPTSVQPSSLQDQLREVQEFLGKVEKYAPTLAQLSSLASTADPSGETPVTTKMATLQEHYNNLKSLAGERHGLEADYLPIVQQYESSRGAWQDLLCGWEEKAEKLPPPSATPRAIQVQLDELKAFQQDITDHEPEFVFLKREINKLCEGPNAESAHFDKLSDMAAEGCPVGRSLPRPGQAEQDGIIANYEERLAALRGRMVDHSETLSSQLEKGKEFETVTSDLSAWLNDLETQLDDFKIRDPKSDVIKAQQQKCQSAVESLASKEASKDGLVSLLASLTSQLPVGSSERDQLQSTLDNLNKRWSDLSGRLGKCKASLDSAHDLASRHEDSMHSLQPWVPDTLKRLENLGPPPTEPDNVQKLKAEIESLKVKYNSLAPAYASCIENGQSLVGVCEEGQPRSDLQANMNDLQDKWEKLKKLFGDLNEKLTAALVQTQEFQGIASGLERWMSGMDDQLRQQDRIAARCKLIEPQIKGFKPILSDLEAYSGTLEQATSVGQSLMTESDEQEKSKIEARLTSMADHFSKLRDSSRKRMTRLEDALKMATKYEEQSDQFDQWLRGVEGKKSSIGAFAIASQPLKAQLEKLKEHVQDVESHKADLATVTASEQSLFDTEMSSIELCEEHLSASPDTSSNQSVLPDWFDRPGAPEAVEVGADLRNRYDKLKVEFGSLQDDGSQLLQRVLGYEEEYRELKAWLVGEKESVQSLPPLAITTAQIKHQLKEVEDKGRDFKNKAETLEAVNMRGTELVDSCKDELSAASGRLKLSDLNDLWGDSLSDLSGREDKLKQGLDLAGKYQSCHDGFDEWLRQCEEQVSLPSRLEGDPREIRRQLEDMKALTEEIERREPELACVVTAGRTLEAYSDADPTSLPDIGYTALQDRYKALNQAVADRESSLTDALGQVSNLRDQLDGLLEQLQKMKGTLKGHEPARVIPADVEKQIKELMVLDKAYGELAPAISKCREEGRSFVSVENGTADNKGIPSGADIQQLLAAIDTASSDVQGLLDYWRDLLASSLETAKKLENDSTSLSSWLQAKEEELAAGDMVRGIPPEVQKQLDEVEVLQSAISQQQPSMDALSSLSHSMAAKCSPEDSLLLGEKLTQLTAALKALQRNALSRRRALSEGLTQAQGFANSWEEAMREIEEKQTELGQFEMVGVDIDTVKAQLDEYKEFESSLTDLKSKINSTLSKGKKLKDSCSPVDGPYLKEQMDQLNAAWSKLNSEGLGRKHKLEDALLQLGQFHDALGELLTWIANCTGRLTEAREPGVEPSAVEGQIQDLETIESGINSHTPSVTSLNSAGEKLLNSSTAENTAEIQRDLADLNKRWSSLQSLASERNKTLADAMEKANDFNERWRAEVGWLSEAERQAYADWKPSGLPQTCEQDIANHDAFVEEVKSHEDQIEAVKAKGVAVKAQGSTEDKKMVDRWVGDLLKRYDDLNFTLDEKNAQLLDAKSRADRFDGLYESLKEKVASAEQVQEGQDPIQSEVEAVKKQMEEHKDHLRTLSDLEHELEELDGWGQLLIKECVTPDGEVIQERINDLKQRCDALGASAAERQTSLEESLLSLGQFEGAYDDLWAWLTGAVKQLEDFEPITGDPDAVAAQLAKHKTLQKQLGARLSSKNAVVKAGRMLMKHKTGEARAVLKKKLQQLEKEWEKVCQVSVDRQDRLEDAYMRIGEFRSHVAPMRSWMDKVQPSLSKSEPVHGDIGTVEALIATHASFQKDLGSYQQNVDAANESGEHLVSKVLDDPTITKDDMSQLNNCWEDLCQLSVDKQDRLDEALRTAGAFEEGLGDLVGWIDEKVRELLAQPEPEEDALGLQQQIENNKVLAQEVAAKQPDFDKVCSDGKSILQLAHPQAVPILESKLQQLEKKWLDLRGKLGARSEALASAQLELHGLQDMLDNLTAWITDAEAKMSETEVMPIGTDMATVEQQLADHEAFQEEMATQQPNMDALNKVAKKRKATNPHSNPGMNKKISSLHKKWQKLWLRSNERNRQLLEASNRLKDIALARSFNFDDWKRRFITWVDQQKLRVNDLFQRFDSNHDGMLTREEFMKALKASGLAMNQIELEKIADSFDKDRSGMIDLSEIISVLKGTNRRTRRPVVQEATLTDDQKIENEIEIQVSRCTCEKKFQVTRVAEGKYRFGDNQKLRLVRILRSTVMVRVGGGWEPLEEFLRKHDPCRASGRTNMDLNTMLQKGPGLDMSSLPASRTKTPENGHHHPHPHPQPHPHPHPHPHTHPHAHPHSGSSAPRTRPATTASAAQLKLNSPRHKATAALTRKTPPRGLTPPRTMTPQARSSTPTSGKPRSTTPISGGRSKSITPAPSKTTPQRSHTPVSAADRRKNSTPAKKEFSPQPGNGSPSRHPHGHTNSSTSPPSSFSSTSGKGAAPPTGGVAARAGQQGTTGIPKASRIPMPSRIPSKSKLPVKHHQ